MELRQNMFVDCADAFGGTLPCSRGTHSSAHRSRCIYTVDIDTNPVSICLMHGIRQNTLDFLIRWVACK
jgi:hypothetical protein